MKIPARLSGYFFAAALVIGKDYHRGSRRRFCAISGKHLWPDVVFAPCRENASGPTSFLRHVGETPLARHRFCAISGEPLLVPLFPGEGTSPVPPQYPDTKTPAGRMTGGRL